MEIDPRTIESGEIVDITSGIHDISLVMTSGLYFPKPIEHLQSGIHGKKQDETFLYHWETTSLYSKHTCMKTEEVSKVKKS